MSRETATRNATERIHIGSRVRIGGQAILDAALRDRGSLRPEPGQMVCAGRQATVTGYHRSPEGRSLYTLKGAPGRWPEAWIDPA